MKSAAQDHPEQRRIWESRCPVLLAERDRYKAALERIADTGYYKREPYSADGLRLGFEIARKALKDGK